LVGIWLETSASQRDADLIRFPLDAELGSVEGCRTGFPAERREDAQGFFFGVGPRPHRAASVSPRPVLWHLRRTESRK
jgi:hypothetical protein